MGVAAYRFTYGLAGALASAALVLPAQADDADLSAQVKMLQDEIASQQQAILAQQQKLQELEKRISEQPRVTGNAALATLRGAGKPGASNAAPQQVSQDQQQTQTQQPVGQAPAEERPQVQTLSDLGGVLSRHGQMTLEPTFEYDNSQFNQLFFSGLEVVNAVFIGGLNATNARRNTLTAGLNGRYGITDYLEANLRVPYVYRTDRQSTGVNTNTLNQNVEGNGIGDVEFGVHYQINRPQNGGAYYVGNLRVKSNTGSGPFDVPYSPTGVALKDNTGSGFWAVEPSLTVLYPSDPVVLFGNIGYTYSFGSTPNQTIGGNFFGHIDPGAVVRFSGGMGFAINDAVTLNFGYEHDWVQSTVSVVNGAKQNSDELQIGSLTMGVSYAITQATHLNFAIGLGATRDAPDVRVLVSLPITLDLFGN